MNILKKIFGSRNERILKKIHPMVEQINALEADMSARSDASLKEQTVLLKQRLADGASLDDILPEAFATVREASRRVLNMRHFDCQLIGGIVLHYGNISEMKTGEGKTLVATLPAYLNALTGKGVHIVTVNDYLASRDAAWMGQIFNYLGMTVGTVVHGLNDDERKTAYRSDITYGTNNEFGFDYLRDNMKYSMDQIAQGYLHYAIVDEVDSILIDEARTPLIISGPAEKSAHLYTQANMIIPALKKERDYTLDEKARSVNLTDEGVARAESLLQVDNLFDHRNIETLHHLNQALKAHTLFRRDTDYIVQNGKVVIVDEFTGRLMPGRRYGEGLHQALEAKENVPIESENQTLASVTFQNYFRMYEKLCGMTGTAETEAEEFKKIYGLDVVVIPTNKPMIRDDRADLIYKTRKEKFDAALNEIIEVHQTGQPILVGTISIDVSEKFSEILKKKGIKHTVLNAKHHRQEAEIVAQAGQKYAVTISTNMAGRGTDIVLGEGVKELGGLHILGTERHESRRIDNQLRGRSGRQGDPGSSRYYLALEDDLLRIFGGERISYIMDKLGMEEGEPIEHRLISRAIENAQRKVEGHNFDIRKHLLEYDDVMNQQREVIYQIRRDILKGESLEAFVEDLVTDIADGLSFQFSEKKQAPSAWNHEGLRQEMIKVFDLDFAVPEARMDDLDQETLSSLIYDAAIDKYHEKQALIGKENFLRFQHFLMLQTVDKIWREHLLSMDHLKEGIGLRGYAQQNPLIVYKKEAFGMFESMMDRINDEIIHILFRVQFKSAPPAEPVEKKEDKNLTYSHGADDGASRKKTVKRDDDKTGRNDPCPCGSGLKYKRCCGK
ncbi:preprotein translocase subunit SecA [Desulfatiferula olefinivorans]